MNFDIGSLPRWFFAFAALLIAVSSAYGMFFAQCTTELFGLTFGKSRACEVADLELYQQVQQLQQANTLLTQQVDRLGTRDRGAVQLTITNNGGGDKNGCPAGSFVSAITAPTGVGGKYATDGLNKITYKCSPLQKN